MGQNGGAEGSGERRRGRARSSRRLGLLGAVVLLAVGGAAAIASAGDSPPHPVRTAAAAAATGRASTKASVRDAPLTSRRRSAHHVASTRGAALATSPPPAARATPELFAPHRHGPAARLTLRSHATLTHTANRRLVVSVPATLGPLWTVVGRVRGQPAAWIAQRSGVTLMRFDQGRVHLTLHAGSSDGGVAGWTYGDRITAREIHLLVAAFNGGFKLNSTNVGFASGGHVAVALKPGLGSVVTYSDGTTDIGAWQRQLPSVRKKVFSVLQNQHLLVDGAIAAATVRHCILVCWGATVRSLDAVARSSLGIMANGQLVWAAAEQLTPAQLAAALIAAGAVRGVELDINPAWVAGYLYAHTRRGPSPAAVVPGQRGIPGQLLAPYSRDFLAIVAN